MIRPLTWLPVVALTASCSLFGPAVTCPDPADLSQVDCDHAVRIATRALPVDQRHSSFNRIVVRYDFCRDGVPCPSTIARMGQVTFYRDGEPPSPVSVTVDPWRAHFIGSPSPSQLP